MYRILANIVVVIHVIVIVFIFGGFFLPKKWKRIKIFHSCFGVMVFVSQVIYGFHCPLVVLEEYLRKLDNPNYIIKRTPFTERLFMRLFGISISINANAILCVIILCAVIGIAHLLTVFLMKKEE